MSQDREDVEAALAEAAETGVFWGEVETVAEIGDAMVALLRVLPAGTRAYLRVKQTGSFQA
jgi:ABC-type uncharacterized transport system YnjBCD ATPase subunit